MAVITDAAEISLPLDAYLPTVEEDTAMEWAVWLLTVDCVAQFGAELEPPPYVYPGVSTSGHTRRYGILDLEAAEAWGYWGSDPAADRERRKPIEVERWEQGITEEIGSLLDGFSDNGVELPADLPEGGCVDWSRRELAGGKQVDENVIFGLANASLEWAEQDPRVQEAFDRWSDCMAEAGFDYDNSWEPNNEGWERPNDTVTDEERTVAAADVRCKHETNLVGLWSTVDAAYQEYLIEEQAEVLTEHVDRRDRAVEHAAQVISEAGQPVPDPPPAE